MWPAQRSSGAHAAISPEHRARPALVAAIIKKAFRGGCATEKGARWGGGAVVQDNCLQTKTG